MNEAAVAADASRARHSDSHVPLSHCTCRRFRLAFRRMNLGLRMAETLGGTEPELIPNQLFAQMLRIQFP